MGEQTKIEWADHTWSPWIGCQKVGPGCDHCYAEALNKRAGGGNWGPGAPRRRTSASYWKQPYRWNTRDPGSVFPSLCDPFDNAVDPAWRRDFGWIIRETPNLTWLLLTKRIGNAAEMIEDMFSGAIAEVADHVMVGSTFVNQDEIDRDWDKLMEVKHHFGVRIFGSLEPLLGPIELPPFGSPYIDWIIAGGESGPGARLMHPDWVRSLRDQCGTANIPFLFKQWGEWLPCDWDNGGDGLGTICWPDDGSERDMAELKGRRAIQNIERQPMWRVGKKLAGRLLDGVQHDGMPTP